MHGIQDHPELFIDLYQDQTMRTVNPDEMNAVNYCFGLIGETGEVIDLIKKHLYQGHPIDDILPKLQNELGDVMWYLCMLANMYGLTMSSVLADNIAKLKKRYPDGFTPEKSINRTEEEN